MNRHALVIHGNKCTSFIFIFMLRFSVDFLWISVSEGTVRFSLCLEQKCLQASPSHPGTAPTLRFTWNDLKAFFPSCTAEKYILTCFFIQIIGLKYYVKLWWRSPNVSGWILWFFLKRACLCAPKLLLGTAEHWEGLLSIPQLTPPGPGCWCSHLTG